MSAEDRHMSADKRLEIAGLAAEILERDGFTSVARKRDDFVTLEWWRAVGERQYHMRHVVTDADMSPEVLALTCAAEFHAALTSNPPS